MCDKATAQRLKPDFVSIFYKDIAFAQIYLGDFDEARKSLYKSVESADKVPDKASQVRSYSFISLTQIKAGDIEGALQTANKIPYSDSGEWTSWKGAPLMELIYYLMDRGDMEQAKKIASGVKEKDIRERLQMHIANYKAKSKDAANTNLKESDSSKKIEFLVSLFPSVYCPDFTDFKSFMESLKEGDEDISDVLDKLIDVAVGLSSALRDLRKFDQEAQSQR